MKIALIGYGKMGHMIEQIALQRGHEIVCKIDVDNQEDFDSPAFASADVAIEFTNPSAAYGNYLRAFKHHVKVVSGSTGWMKDHKEDVERIIREEHQTLFWVEMEETHHVHKLDAPSGTAITLADEIVERLDRKSCWKKGTCTWDDGHVDGNSDHNPDELLINSVRHDEVPGIHTISYDSEADCITISHSAHSRKGFALGAVLAAEFTQTHEGLLTTSDLFKF